MTQYTGVCFLTCPTTSRSFRSGCHACGGEEFIPLHSMINTVSDSETIYRFEISILMYVYFTTDPHSGFFIVSAVDRDIWETRNDDISIRLLIKSFLIYSDKTCITFYSYLESNTNLMLSTNVNIHTNRVQIIYFFNTTQPKEKKMS